MTEKAVAVIPARLESTRLPRKVLVDICGKPMIQHIYERAASAETIGRVLVATDSEEVMRTIEGWGDVIMTAPNLPSGTARIASIIGLPGIIDAEIIVDVQADQPLVEPEMIDCAVKILRNNAVDIITPVVRITETQDLLDPDVVKVVRGEDHRTLYFSRHPIPYVRDVPVSEWLERTVFWAHHGIYGFKRYMLEVFNSILPVGVLEGVEKLEQLRFLEAGYDIHTFETQFPHVAVDSLEDLERVRNTMTAPATSAPNTPCS